MLVLIDLHFGCLCCGLLSCVALGHIFLFCVVGFSSCLRFVVVCLLALLFMFWDSGDLVFSASLVFVYVPCFVLVILLVFLLLLF